MNEYIDIKILEINFLDNINDPDCFASVETRTKDKYIIKNPNLINKVFFPTTQKIQSLLPGISTRIGVIFVGDCVRCEIKGFTIGKLLGGTNIFVDFGDITFCKYLGRINT